MLREIFHRLIRGRVLFFLFLLSIIFSISLLESFSLAAMVPLIESTQQTGDEAVSVISRFFSWLCSLLGVDFSIASVLLVLVLFLFLKSLLGILKTFLIKSLQMRNESEAKKDLFELILATKGTYLFKQDFGKIANVATEQTRYIGSLVVYVTIFTNFLFNILAYFCLIFFVSWKLTLVVFFVGSAIYLILFPLYKWARKIGYRIANTRASIQGCVQDCLAGFHLVKSYVMEVPLVRRLEKNLSALREDEVKISLLEAIQGSFLEPVMVLLAFFVFKYSSISIASLLIFLVALGRLYQALRNIQNTHYKISVFVSSLDLYEEICDGLRRNKEEETGDLPFEHLEKEIRFNEVAFQYETSQEAFRLGPIDLQFPAGKMIGLVGRSGSGKSTCVDLVIGLLAPQQGGIQFDDTPLPALDIKTLRKKIGYIPQDTFIFHDTVHYNITLGDDSYQLPQIREACELAHIAEFIEGQPEKYNTILGEKGTTLSGGQRQRIAFARALVRRPEILILDEATNAMDNETEKNIQDMLHSLYGTLTIIVIAHRLNTVKNADIIFFFEQGKVIESGSFEELTQLQGHFAHLYTQAS
jgi:ABC-type bacteriocin/lantibiotic exporter with double-glycine peptidase domain